MLSLSFLSLLPLALASVLPRDVANYDGYKVLRVSTNGDAAGVMEKLSALNYDQWSARVADYVDISMSDEEYGKFQTLGLTSSMMHEDLGADIAAETTDSSEYQATVLERRQNGALPSTAWFNSYHSYSEHVQYWRDLQAAFPSNSQRFVVGNSFENREIFGLKLFGANTGASKKAVIWHGTVHAREWITTMTVEYLAYNIINGYKNNNATYRALLDGFDFYILPVVNPDGFSYSQTNDRLWRKQRKPVRLSNGRTCFGTDMNRNWPYQWTGDPNGASTDPCAQTYKGQAQGDTPEIKALVSHMQSVSRSQNLTQYIDFHSYGNYILSPYGYTSAVPANNNQQVSLGQRAAAAIRAVYGTQYTVGPSGATLYPTTGSSGDYAYDIAGAEYSYCMELRDKGQNGFVLPANQILPTGQEVLAGVLVLLDGKYLEGGSPRKESMTGISKVG